MLIVLTLALFFIFCFFVWAIVPSPLSVWLMVAGGISVTPVRRVTAIYSGRADSHDPPGGQSDSAEIDKID